MRVIIAGSRSILPKDPSEEEWLTAKKIVYKVCDDAMRSSPHKFTEIICGKAQGVDTLGEMWAKSNDIVVKYFPANWKKHGKRAGYLRNIEMAKYGDALILIWDGVSRGSKTMKEIAIKKGLSIFEYVFKRKEA